MSKQYAVIYSRFSPRPNKEECRSIEKQVEACERWCTFKEMEILNRYEDRALSAARADNRPGLQEALDMVCKTGAALVVYSLPRLARNVKDALDIVDRLNKYNLCLNIVQLHVDTSTHMGKFFYTVIAAFAEMERSETAKRTKDAMIMYQNNGRRMSDKTPYGTIRDPENPNLLLDDKEEQANISRIVDLRVDGLSLRGIVDQLNAEGIEPRMKQIKYPDGTKENVPGKWNHVQIRRILMKEGVK